MVFAQREREVKIVRVCLCEKVFGLYGKEFFNNQSIILDSDGFPTVWRYSQSLHLGVRKEQVG